RFLKVNAVRLLLLRQEAPRVGLRVAEAGERVLDAAPDSLRLRQAAEHRLALRKPGRHVFQPEAGNLLDHVDLTRHVARTPGRHDDALALDVEFEPLQDRVLLVRSRFEAADGVGSLRPEADGGPFWQPL